MVVLNKLLTVTYTQKLILRKLVGLKNSVRGPYVARGPVVGPRCTKCCVTWRTNRKICFMTFPWTLISSKCYTMKAVLLVVCTF